MTTISPADLRFTQESIASHFKSPYEHFSIKEALKKIRTGKMSADDFPRIRVISHEGCLWAIDNRRLWVFRKSKCPQITVELTTTMHPRLRELLSLGRRCEHLSRVDFFPKVRTTQDVSPLPTMSRKVRQKGTHPRVAEVMSRYGLSSVGGSQNVWAPPRVASKNLQGATSGLGRQPLRPAKLVSLNFSVVTMEGSVTPALRSAETLDKEAHVEPQHSSLFSGSAADVSSDGSIAPGLRSTETADGGADMEPKFSSSLLGSSAVQPTEEPNDLITTCLPCHKGDLGKRNFEHTPLLPQFKHDDERPTESWVGWVRMLIFGCFGR